MEGEEEGRVDQALSGEDAVCTSKDEALTVSADEALLSTDEAMATTEEEIHPDSTCTTEIASECMQQPHVSVLVYSVRVYSVCDPQSLAVPPCLLLWCDGDHRCQAVLGRVGQRAEAAW